MWWAGAQFLINSPRQVWGLARVHISESHPNLAKEIPVTDNFHWEGLAMIKYALIALTMIGSARPALADFYVVLNKDGCSVRELTNTQRAETQAKIVGNGYKLETDALQAISGLSQCKQPL